MIKILYFARLKDTLNCAEEELALDEKTRTVGDLLQFLAQRDELWKNTLSDSRVLCAINQEVSSLNAAIKAGDELAFFPPVTGG